MKLHVIWFKRDLRLEDHAALTAAAKGGEVLPLVMVEPAYWQLRDTSHRQYKFWRRCVEDVAIALQSMGGTLVVRCGDATEILQNLKTQFGEFELHAHEETGNSWTYARDMAVHRWCHAEGLKFKEYAQFGVLRGKYANRDRWATQWDKLMSQPVWQLPAKVCWQTAVSDALPEADALGLQPDGLQRHQVPGRVAALDDLRSFLDARGQFYTQQMSSPLTAEQACSRLSVHLAYGSLSMREAAQAASARYAKIDTLPRGNPRWKQSIRSFIARLHWHCHFIQKLESEPEAEHRPFARIYEGLRPAVADAVALQAWTDGRTGYPFIDAAMRYLTATGWINFRMRAMLMSFAAYDLWLPWQESGLVLAQRFIDYEPGIHWPQCQMQSGETGINTVRVYSPVKQSHDQDIDGTFIREWVPELAQVPLAYVHEPWRLDAAQRQLLCPDYPAPIVDHAEATAIAKARIYALRKIPEARAEAQAVHTKHGSRKRAAPRAIVPKSVKQYALDF